MSRFSPVHVAEIALPSTDPSPERYHIPETSILLLPTSLDVALRWDSAKGHTLVARSTASSDSASVPKHRSNHPCVCVALVISEVVLSSAAGMTGIAMAGSCIGAWHSSQIMIGIRSPFAVVVATVMVVVPIRQTYYRWRQKYGGLSPEMVKELRCL